MRIDWGAAWSALPVLLQGLLVTLQVTLLGMSLALLLGLVWTLSRRSPRRWISYPAAGFVEAIRSTPLLVQVYFLFYVLPSYGIRLSPLATGVVAVGLHYSAYTSEVYRAGIEGVPRGQWEAAIALNLRPLQTWMSIILPQAIPPVIPALGNYFIAMFKDTPILSAIAVLEVMQTAKILGSETFRYLEPFTLVGLLFLGLSLVAAALVRWAERKLGVRSASP
ncbi:MAG: ectoine/hydroxyectoine ABC transporter permease subunit EhuD [Candidatus Omnitrophica bacterium]|nr:L-cystine transport system permease protein YecS [bacterium]NUN95534.1 ectoine/hydroxyectoine ABC transporter permease subunit EhuD [Candidatus Omnitrophota bacterium]